MLCDANFWTWFYHSQRISALPIFLIQSMGVGPLLCFQLPVHSDINRCLQSNLYCHSFFWASSALLSTSQRSSIVLLTFPIPVPIICVEAYVKGMCSQCHGLRAGNSQNIDTIKDKRLQRTWPEGCLFSILEEVSRHNSQLEH